MIGYYIHHQGMGHLRRAQAIAAHLPAGGVTGLSSLPRPAGWNNPWIRLDRDDTGPEPASVDANGRLHWVPLHDAGLRERMGQLSAWLREAAPAALVTDVSVEAAVLARLHGIPVISVALPGQRGDSAHTLGFGISDAVISAWPPEAPDMLAVSGDWVSGKLFPVGAISGIPVQPGRPPGPVTRVVVLGGAGGGGMNDAAIEDARRQTPGVDWVALGTNPENRTSDPLPHLRDASLVVTHAGQGAVADAAAAGVPAVIVPLERPHQEQVTTGRALSRMPGLPAIVSPAFARSDWAQVLAAAAQLDGRGWSVWNDGKGASRAARVIADVAAAIPAAAGTAS
ncbi:glycosyltransferase [Arthrobacter sp. APC 3897]|uniref:glycosyltransferase n=1 Tax=Arthrobacter sp. APC 3897 TaxID=3035204 RepID=UPI0025B2C3DA|nr:glycosyltransferase [Arthrobacter sp. APC 3897]MDN3483627.1 glycosyltransferase [Arthrobacter sp. APC 3897]